MYDPMTVAFSFLGITIWHVDPERQGDDDSCDWWGKHRVLNPREALLSAEIKNIEHLLDNRPHYPDSPEHKQYQVIKAAKCEWLRRSKWRIPVRWHVWHWSIRIDALLHLKRWLFSRCCVCGGRFSWGYCPLSHSWSGDGPRWFKSEKHVLHMKCDDTQKRRDT